MKIKDFRVDPNEKIMIISHNDLDGAGPILIADKVFNNYEYFCVSNNAVDKMVKNVLFNSQYQDVTCIFITDCSITDKNLADTITQINQMGTKRIYLMDHHGTATWLNEYDWAEVTEEKYVSGTKVFHSYLLTYPEVVFGISDPDIIFLTDLTNTISDWDTYRWKVTEDPIPRMLADLFKITGIKYFLEKYRNDTDKDMLLSILDNAILNEYYNKQIYINIPGIKKTAATLEIAFPVGETHITKTVKCVSVADAPADLAEELYEDGIDYVIMFYSNGTISLRSRVSEIDLGMVAKVWGNGKGGGHKQAAGFTMDKNTLWLYTSYLAKRYCDGNINELWGK